MPRWTWSCNECGHDEDRIVPLRLRDDAYACPKCYGVTTRQFSYEAALGFMPFEPHYDEGLGADIHSRREKQRVMRALNVHEAGDPQGGARVFDKHAPEHIKPSALRGEPFVDRKSLPEEATPIGTVGKDGRTRWRKSTDLKSV